MFVDDTEMFHKLNVDDLWVYDKLILSKKLGYVCGPHGTEVPRYGKYIVRPCVNFMGMGRGAYFKRFWKETENKMPDGTFWCEIFKGRHLSIDYTNQKQVLCVEGIKGKNDDSLWRWLKWIKTNDEIEFPHILKKLCGKYKYINCEYINGKLIEVHFRKNVDWELMPKAKEIVPIFKGDIIIPPSDEYEFIKSKDFKRLGFYWK
tara:strand:- start:14459 stop:15070 length:612 start_codon:yes stop_codon:yes gene_type:complete